AGFEAGGQAYAENRSRPIYPERSGGGNNRNGRRGPGNGRDGRWRRQAPPVQRSARPIGLPEMEEQVPTLPDNPREAALKILHAADTRSAFSDRLLDGAHARTNQDPRD